MKLELRNVQYAAFASEETHCFSATIYIDGVKRGTVSNDGHGGCDHIIPWELHKELNEYAATLPERDIGYCDPGTGANMTMKQDAETLIGELMNEWLYTRDVKRLTAKRIVFTKSGQTGIYQTKVLPKPTIEAALGAEQLQTTRLKLKAETILNTLPITEAVRLFRAGMQS